MDWLAKMAGRKPIEPAQPISAHPITRTPMMDRMASEARRDMGEERWQQLNSEWN